MAIGIPYMKIDVLFWVGKADLFRGALKAPPTSGYTLAFELVVDVVDQFVGVPRDWAGTVPGSRVPRAGVRGCLLAPS